MSVLVALWIELDQRLGIIGTRLIEPFGGFAEQGGFASGLSLSVETGMITQIQSDTAAGISERNHFLNLVNREVHSILNAGAIRRRQVDGQLSPYGGCAASKIQGSLTERQTLRHCLHLGEASRWKLRLRSVTIKSDSLYRAVGVRDI